MEIQPALGSDIAMVFDECPPYPCEHDYAARSLELTLRWAARCKRDLGARVSRLSGSNEPLEDAADRRVAPLIFGIVQGGTFETFAEKAPKPSAQIGFRWLCDWRGERRRDRSGNDAGGGTERAVSCPAISRATRWGSGRRRRLVELVARGVDMFDCVLPTRLARNGTAYTASGAMNLKNSAFTMHERPIEAGCACPACQGFSRGYLRHLIKAEEILGLRLVSLHNLHFYIGLMERARAEIENGCFDSFRQNFVTGYRTSNNA